MSQNDEFNLRDLLGDNPEELGLPDIGMTPSSELPLIGKPLTDEKVDARVKAAQDPNYIANGHKTEQLSHPIPPAPEVTFEGTRATVSPAVPDEVIDYLSAEYQSIFNGAVTEVKDMSPEQLQARRHQLMRRIQEDKIAIRAIRITEEGKLQYIEEKRRAAIRVKDAEFMAKHKAVTDTSEKKPRVKGASSDKGLSTVEKQVKQFVKLNMDEATIRTTLTAVGTAIPSNLTELISRFRK